MKPLPIEQALQLYMLLAPHLPEVSETETMLSFVGKIIDNIISSQQYRVYPDAVALMMGVTIDVLISELSSDEILTSFSEGLRENNVIFLQEFCKRIGIYA